MNDFNTAPAAVHRLELVGRERLVVSGVEDVDRFDETGIVMATAAGTCTSANCRWMAESCMWMVGATP